MLNRRGFLASLLGTAVATPVLLANNEQILTPAHPNDYYHSTVAFVTADGTEIVPNPSMMITSSVEGPNTMEFDGKAGLVRLGQAVYTKIDHDVVFSGIVQRIDTHVGKGCHYIAMSALPGHLTYYINPNDPELTRRVSEELLKSMQRRHNRIPGFA